jgi:hypothetical protein
VRDKILFANLALVCALFCSNVSGSSKALSVDEQRVLAAQACFDTLDRNARSIVGGPFITSNNGTHSVCWVEYRGGDVPDLGEYQSDNLNSIASCASAIGTDNFLEAYGQGFISGLKEVAVDPTYPLTIGDLKRTNPRSTLAAFKKASLDWGLPDPLRSVNATVTAMNGAIIGLGVVCLVGIGFFVVKYALKKQ